MDNTQRTSGDGSGTLDASRAERAAVEAPTTPPDGRASETTVAPPTTPTRVPTTSTPVARRIRGIDMARALAIIGMVMVHFGPTTLDEDTVAGFVWETSHGRASILFIVLAGIGVSLLAGDRSPQRLRGTTQRLLFRAAVLLPMGLWLQTLGTRVAVILQYYAVYFLIAAFAVRLRDRWLLTGAVGALLTAPLVYLAAWFAAPSWFRLGVQSTLADGAELVRDLLLTGYYPALTWTAPLLFGMWLGRRDLRTRATRRRLLWWGAGAASAAYLLAWRLTLVVGAPPASAPSWRWLAVAEPHTQMPLWLLSSTGVAAAILGASLLLADRFPRLTWPLVASGQLALTTYVGHLLLLWQMSDWLVRDTVPAAFMTTLLFSVAAVAGATVWRRVADRGPLEWLLHLPFRRRGR